MPLEISTKHRSETKNGSCDVVLDIMDEVSVESSILEFGQLPATDYKANWLWKCQGQVKVIVTEYHNGVHYSTKPYHFLPIIAHLEQLHANHYVHGDIRAFNMVLQYPDHEANPNGENRTIGIEDSWSSTNAYKECKGWLIDFDYGGMLSTDTGTENIEQSTTGINQRYDPIYPKGYVKNLGDGSRLGEAGDNIKYEDDWFALGEIIFNLHHIPEYADIKDMQVRDSLSRLKEAFLSVRYRETSPDAANAIREYLQLASDQGVTLSPAVKFYSHLVENDLLEYQTQQMNSNCATGSPPPPPKK